jgi:hypothetical protein
MGSFVVKASLRSMELLGDPWNFSEILGIQTSASMLRAKIRQYEKPRKPYFVGFWINVKINQKRCKVVSLLANPLNL